VTGSIRSLIQLIGSSCHDRPSTQTNDAHLKRPYPADPHTELALDASNTLQLDAFPPASTCWFAPEKQQFLCHTDCIAAHLIPANVTPQPRQRQTADDGLPWFRFSVSPKILPIESAVDGIVSPLALAYRCRVVVVLLVRVKMRVGRLRIHLPSCEHLDEMGFGRTRLITPLEP
jgi:hypothetical protein